MHADPARAAELGRMGGRVNRHYVETADSAIAAPSDAGGGQEDAGTSHGRSLRG